ncbi:hypothetical protein ACGFIF_07145 [Kribbella sp. NPDC049174]|uniref:aromatic-ring hydroxylase C-terminal domain-containing protein n=1 Tax=Kribbella sp. NPDC049174 TaxID=3364112 RepID=UPI00372005C1
MNYRGSVLSHAGTPTADRKLQPGDRLPDATVVCEGRTARLHELTATPGIHLLLSADAEPSQAAGPRIHVHRLARGGPGPGVVAVRPDGYVGFRSGSADPAGLDAWLRLVGAR